MKRRRIGYVILSSSSWALQPKAITSQRLGPQNDVASTNPNDDVLYPLQELSADRYKSTVAFQNVTVSKSYSALLLKSTASLRDEKYRFLVKSTLVKVTVAPAGRIGISRYGDISVTHEDLLALVRIEVAAGRHRA
ncbi:hypothetical protein F511_03484 [Dorcoceras hygrometricum]|uniref:Uncharacterized protein n=1 Tax=Dorcoceras hygrometricum TaxID=472368 RepID=A0A2Z7DC93_9LAMI|nr:hypothetical protein F511_03484 [Dorcoceras hygrometricum]